MRLIVGLFECGCPDGNFASLEAVHVENTEQIIKIKDLMRVRSVEYQCSPMGATEIFEIDGSVFGLTITPYLTYVENHSKPR